MKTPCSPCGRGAGGEGFSDFENTLLKKGGNGFKPVAT